MVKRKKRGNTKSYATKKELRDIAAARRKVEEDQVGVTPEMVRQAQVKLNEHYTWVLANQVWTCGCGCQEFVLFESGEVTCTKCRHVNTRLKAVDRCPPKAN